MTFCYTPPSMSYFVIFFVQIMERWKRDFFCAFGCLSKPCCENGGRKGQKLHTDTHVLTGKEKEILAAKLAFNKGCS